MKNFWIAAISLMAAVSLAACGASAPAASSSPSSEAVSSGVVSSEKASSESTPEESDASPDSQQLEKMSAPRYVGVVDDFAVNDAGETVLIMKPSHGGDANGSLKAVAVQINDTDEVPAGSDGLPDFDMEESVSYDGVVLSVSFDPSNPKEGSIEMTDFDGQMPYVFHFNEETTVKEIQPQTKLHIEHSQISTRSLPPQSNAFSISPYQSDAQ